ncbi:MAG: hypothetical protein HOE90_17530 [Bacteriovoracaceae bacterium]|jgi:fructoselysine 6-kinase|nr:hypothetical protein [Bacteriovoracaceae bacterium]
MKIICVGDAGIDEYRNLSQSFVGGCSLNNAYHLTKDYNQLCQTSLFSPIGSDASAERVLSFCKKEGIEFLGKRYQGSTPSQIIEVLPSGEKQFISYHEGVFKDFSLSRDDLDLIENHDLVVTVVFDQNQKFFDSLYCEAESKFVIDFMDLSDFSYDLDFVESYLGKCQMAVIGFDHYDELMVLKVKKLAADYNRDFLLTFGAQGALFISEQNSQRVDAKKVEKVVDTTGAGDAFLSYFIGEYTVRGESVSRSLEVASEHAKKVVERLGCHAL